MSTSFGWGKGGNVTSAGWQAILCDPMWHVSSCSGVATLQTAIHLLLTYLLKHTRWVSSVTYNAIVLNNILYALPVYFSYYLTT